MSSDDIAISVRNLTKTYRIFGHPGDRLKQAMTFGMRRYHREFTALKDVSFDIKKGETVGIIGRNGSGKSTLLQLICGILKPTAGSVQANSRIAALLELGAGFNPEFTGRENVYFQGALRGFSQVEMDGRFHAIAAFADIGQFIDQPVRTYSSGMFVRLAFSVAIQVSPEVLIIDEALAVGDLAFQQKCVGKMGSLRSKGITILVVSHDLHLIERFCDRVLVLEGGSCVSDGPAPEAVATFRNLLQFHQDVATISDSSPEVRYSTGAVAIRTVEILDKVQQPRSSFVTGEDLIVRLHYVAQHPVRNVYFACSIWVDSETRLGTATMIAEHPEPFGKELVGEFEVLLTLPKVPLLPGLYFLRGGVYDDNLHHAYCLWGWTGPPLAQFTITSSTCNGFVLKSELGFVLLPSRWKVSKIHHG